MERPITLITGTRKGIGKYLVEHYVRQGHIVIGCSRDEPDWTLDGYDHYKVDVSVEKEVKALFSFIKKKYGRLDHLINNAGIASMNHFLLTPISTVNKILNTNVVGTFLFSREAAKLMQKQGYGRIVNFTTVAAPLKLEGESIYAASKAAVISFTEVIARELSSYGITVNSIGPAPIETDLIRSVPKEKLEALINRQAIKRYGTVEDVANAVDFFLQKESSFITGQTLFLGGV
ncbi:SDR family oxidoreductase [Neobacillus niacini]|uniref:SDR family NAD(P)-dependent oxidoreductase n=1 Tax=Neobacillus niacini TaxID=86668 RepID=UPI002FFE6059